ncbi:MAG: hypothetical protein SPF98_01990 [Campylobacter sp.]|nr:hypothetical protein [Campylobacter sp.]
MKAQAPRLRSKMKEKNEKSRPPQPRTTPHRILEFPSTKCH